MSPAGVPVNLEVRLDSTLRDQLQRADPDLNTCRQRLAAGISLLVTELGLPVEPRLSMGEAPRGGSPVEVILAGSPCPSARRISSLPLYSLASAAMPAGYVTDLAGALESLAEDGDAAGAAGALTAMVAETVHTSARLLLTPDVIERWAIGARLPAGWEPETVLRELVSLGLSPGTGAEVNHAIEDLPPGSTAGLEAAISARADGPWDIQVNPDSLRALMARAVTELDRFRKWREAFAADSGVRLPALTIDGDHSLPPGRVSFRLFGVTSPFVFHLPAAAEAPAGEAATVPAGPSPGELMIWALGLFARDRMGALVTTATTARELAGLSRWYPKLSEMTSVFAPETVTRLLRALVTEGVSMCNLPSILQAMLDVYERSGSILDDAELLHQVRVRLSPLVTRAAAGAADHLEVWRVPILSPDLSSSDAADRLLAFASQVATSGTLPGRVLVTSPTARVTVRAVVSAAYPMLAVLGEDELGGTPQAAITAPDPAAGDGARAREDAPQVSPPVRVDREG